MNLKEQLMMVLENVSEINKAHPHFSGIYYMWLNQKEWPRDTINETVNKWIIRIY